MSKCTGKRCPMQVGFDVSKCQAEDCSYRTDPKTNYDRIRNMSVEELAEFICGIFDENETLTGYFKDKFINGTTIPDYDEDRIKEWLESEVTEE